MRLESVPSQYKNLYRGKWRRPESRGEQSYTAGQIKIHDALYNAMRSKGITIPQNRRDVPLKIAEYERLTGVENKNAYTISYLDADDSIEQGFVVDLDRPETLR